VANAAPTSDERSLLPHSVTQRAGAAAPGSASRNGASRGDHEFKRF
jgi:hypothetical protein